MKKVIATVKRWDKKHNDWMESLESWQEALYVTLMCAVGFGLWCVRPEVFNTWIHNVTSAVAVSSPACERTAIQPGASGVRVNEDELMRIRVLLEVDTEILAGLRTIEAAS